MKTTFFRCLNSK